MPKVLVVRRPNKRTKMIRIMSAAIAPRRRIGRNFGGGRIRLRAARRKKRLGTFDECKVIDSFFQHKILSRITSTKCAVSLLEEASDKSYEMNLLVSEKISFDFHV